ncbi:Nucleoid-associated protein Lsr2 [Nocardioides dokdonensis FR1436]|uniref:Nucleoid-associated protein Lsr2 n=1 Tax=Nocardioides dokdonensis FR1436 TaxID=1300347 RepID=A0A1A9GIH9_9ACTN|nr:Lsr2 family protein [Nocardioides dokdonensis]ANH38119.1 Nucleoid-associated protein Lsr2 [Nocardioides dokdonensis FR1436]
MAQKVQIILEDDLDGSEAHETVSFALDGTSYEIDLTEENAATMRDAFARYVGHARKVSGTRRSGARRSSPSAAGGSNGSGSNAKEIREWARERGMEVSERGRVSAEVREAYDAAH